ncbi:MAG: hypothetical protein ABIW81_05385 [Terrimesophilobacter sp.]
MIAWAEFGIVAVASLVGACVLVTFASVGIRLVESRERTRAARPAAGHLYGAGALAAFAVCAATVVFGIYLIVPAFN